MAEIVGDGSVFVAGMAVGDARVCVGESVNSLVTCVCCADPAIPVGGVVLFCCAVFLEWIIGADSGWLQLLTIRKKVISSISIERHCLSITYFQASDQSRCHIPGKSKPP